MEKKARPQKKDPASRIPRQQVQEIEELKARTAELDRVAKMLVRRDLELSEVREQREQELEELKAKTTELEDARRALLNILADTEQARGQAEQERKRVELILSNLSDGLLVFDANQIVEFVNPQAESILDIKSSSLVGKHMNKVKAVVQFPWLKNLILKEHNGDVQRELSFPQSSLVFETTAVPLQYGDEHRGVILVFHDITREKQIELLKSEFVSLAAHQLRTPLSAIKWSLRVLLDGDLGSLGEKQKDLVLKTFDSNERMIRLINDLLNVARIEEGKYLYQPSLHQIEEIVRSMIQSYKAETKRRGVVLTLKVEDKIMPKVLLDEEKIRLVLQNLLDNAMRYTATGGEVTVVLSCDTKEVRIAVRDNGMGIPQNQQQRVFEKFFRATNAKRVDTDGSGLGLYLVKNIIEAHKGRVWFESKEGKGTTFTFTLPREGKK